MQNTPLSKEQNGHQMNTTGLYEPNRQHDACGVGFIARLDAKPQHSVIEEAISALARMEHRGGAVFGPENPDGAGLLLSMPHDFIKRTWEPLCGTLPERYAIGHFFFTTDEEMLSRMEMLIEVTLAEHGLHAIKWRDTPINKNILQKRPLEVLPTIRQLLISIDNDEVTDEEFERLLFVTRKHISAVIKEEVSKNPDDFHVASLSSRSITYKAMLSGGLLSEFYTDLANRYFSSHFAIFHERYSTNTKPAWRLAQPFHCLAHNGEINTINGNRANMLMREPLISSPLFGTNNKYLRPTIDDAGSDSAMLDNALELLVKGGRSLTHAAMMLLPEPFGDDFIMGQDKRAFYEYHASIMEPWDGPAALVFTDGSKQIGAILDRNSLRPCRYAVTKDGLFVLASEAGVLDIPSDKIVRRGRLNPRKMLLIDFARKRLVTDAECKGRVVYNTQYRHWIKENRVRIKDLPLPEKGKHQDSILLPETLKKQQLLFGYAKEDINDIITPMATNAQEPVASMGADIPLAALSSRPQLFFSYFKQRFAQVTNPPIDPLREGLVMSLNCFAGKCSNLLEDTPDHYAKLRLFNPILFEDSILRLTASTHPFVKTATVGMLFRVPTKESHAGEALEKGIEAMLAEADAALDNGATILILSDDNAGLRHVPIPSNLAVSALHHHLLRTERRHACSIFVNTGEAREVMHIAQLLSLGASAIYPRTAIATVKYLANHGKLGKTDITEAKALTKFATALQKGLLKTFSRLGISTVRSFVGSQIFEPLGVSQEVLDKYFTGLVSKIGGVGISTIATEALARHALAFRNEQAINEELPEQGRHRHRKDGEKHLWTPEGIRALHKAVREDDYESYREYADSTDLVKGDHTTLRSLMDFTNRSPIPLEEVEPEENILPRFVGAAMSFGSISPEAHEAIAIAMNRVGAYSNCGEGGEDPDRNILGKDGKNRRSRIRQIASGRFGVTASYLANADEVQIKVAQGAKPGEGGQLPAHKVLPLIAKVRHTTPGVTLISPPPHHDIYSIEDLAQLIFDVKRINPTASVSVKLVAGFGVGTIASGVAKAGADGILISGHDGGTGAAPRSAMNHVGMPWELGLAESHQTLVGNGLRHLVRLQADGQLHTGRDLVVAALLGAEEYGFGAALLVALGCCMLRVCHLGTCPVGVATQDPRLRAKFAGKPEHIERLLRFLARDMREHMAKLGFRTVEEMIGRSDVLAQKSLPKGDKASQLDLSRLINSTVDAISPRCCNDPRPNVVDSPLETAMLDALMPGIAEKRLSRFEAEVRNTDRSVGTRVAGEVVKRYGDEGLTPGTIDIVLKGTAGQSAGAFLAKGISLSIRGEANDYVGKGLSGGTIVVSPPRNNKAFDDKQAAIGNVALYGATSGEAFFCGSAGERFAVRNSGAVTVVEGVGDHACEYMTGGTVVVLGTTGYNFAAGMSGGYAYVYDKSEMFLTRCNMDGVDLESVWQKEDVALLHNLLSKHVRLTGSSLATAILEEWAASLPLFLKVTPIEYQRALARMKLSEARSAENVAATEEVFNR